MSPPEPDGGTPHRRRGVTEAIIFDLDGCLAEADEHPEILDPGFEAIRRANRGTLSEAEVERALEDCRRRPFHRVARERGFSDAMIEAGRRAFSRTVVRRPMTGYPDLPVLEKLPGKKFLVTTGFRRLQESKIEALGVAPLFDGVHIDAIDDGRPRGKGAIFRDILREHDLRPERVWVVGDDPESEIEAGNRIGMPTVQILRPGVERGGNADRHVRGLEELRELLGRTEAFRKP